MHRFVTLTLAASLGTSLLVPAAVAAPDDAASPDRQPTALTPPPADVDRMPLGEGTAPREYFVRLAGLPAALDTEGAPGRAPAARRGPDGSPEFRGDSAETRATRAELASEQGRVASQGARGTVGRELEIAASYTVANHGFATTMTPAEARELARLDEVVWIQEFPEYEPLTDRGPGHVGARGPVWDRPDTGAADGTLGEGVVVGIIDTGINPSSPSFAAVSADGYAHTNPRGAGSYVGSCDPTNVPGGAGEGVALVDFGLTVPDGAHHDEALAELCNDKLIGMWGYNSVTGSPIDANGHGSHTAGTAAGGFADAVVADTGVAALDEVTFDVAGVAPRASIISYNACCSGVGLVSAIDQAIVDGVDVINFSIGSTAPTADPLQDPLAFGFLVARLNGVHVATSAGNSGPNAATVGSPADAPWLTSVAASTHDRLALNTVTGIVDAATGDALPAIEGKGVSAGLDGDAPLVYAGDHGNPLCLPDRWDAEVFDGEIVVCDRGETARVDKAVQAAAAGAGGFVLANDPVNAGSVPGSLNGDSFPIPGVHVTTADGEALKGWMAAVDEPRASISGTTFDVDERWGDVVAIFSSRGPNRSDADLLTPHVTAPGVDILAPYGADDATIYQFISGTSMSSPHVAGALALLVDGFDGALTPSQAQSALQLTARRDVRDTDGTSLADAFDVGSGHIDVAAALATGLVMDQDAFGFFDAVLLGETRGLNLASVTDAACVATCSWTRTVTAAPGTGTTSWTAQGAGDAIGVSVEPAAFTLAEGESQELMITADVAGATVGSPAFGSVELISDGSTSDAHLPVVVRPAAFGGPDTITIDADDVTGEVTERFTSAGVDGLAAQVAGLAPADVARFTVPQDPTPGAPFDDLDQVEVRTVEVPADGRRLTVLLGETTSPDLDLFVGHGTEPSAATLVCASAAPASAERCDVPSPAAGPWWIVVQNWEASPAGADDAELLTVVVPDEGVGNLTADVPSTVAPGAFDVSLAWDFEPIASRWFGDLTLSGGDEATTVPIELTLDPALVDVDPTADAGGPYDARPNRQVTLDGTGSSSPVDAALTSTWDLSSLGLEDVEGATPTVTVGRTGTYPITLTVTDDEGRVATDDTVIEVRGGPPAEPGPPPGRGGGGPTR